MDQLELLCKMPAKPLWSVFKLDCSFPVGKERKTALSVLLNGPIKVLETPALCTKVTVVLSFFSFSQLETYNIKNRLYYY